jgi:hypothetical protein
LDYFFVADSTCLVGGPHFSYKFYITTTGIAGSVASLITVVIYQYVFSKWKFRSVLIFTTILSGVGGIFDYIIVKRWNLQWGIPDAWFFLIGDDVLHSMIEMLFWIPSSSIIGKVCPKNMEASTYAFLAGISNFGYMISVISGALLTEFFGIHTIVPCNWDNLPMVILWGHIIIMVVISVPACFLIPNEEQDADLLKSRVEIEWVDLEEEDFENIFD